MSGVDPPVSEVRHHVVVRLPGDVVRVGHADVSSRMCQTRDGRITTRPELVVGRREAGLPPLACMRFRIGRSAG